MIAHPFMDDDERFPTNLKSVIVRPMKRFLLSLLLCLPVLAFAKANVLYQAEIPVSSTDKAARRDAIQAAAKQVLVKVSGNQGINTLPFIKDQLGHAGNWVEKYRYRRSSPYAPLLLVVQFEKSNIDQAIKSAGQAIWSQTRPSILSWVVLKKADQSSLLSADSDSSATLILSQAAKQRGIDVIFPLGDLADMTVTPEMIEKGDCQAVMAASKRYHRDTLLCANLEERDGHWQGQWTLLFQQERMTWTVSGATKEAAIENGINNITESLAARMAVMKSAGQSDQIEITVNGVKSINDYAALSKLLRDLDSVSQIEVTRVAPEQVSYNVQLTASLSTFVQNLAQSGHLQASETVTDLNNHSLNYQWAS